MGQNLVHINLFQTDHFHFYKLQKVFGNEKKILLKFCGQSVTSFHILFSGSTIDSTPKERKSKIDFGDLCRLQK